MSDERTTVNDLANPDVLRRFALLVQREHDPAQQDAGYHGRCAVCGFTRHPCDTYSLASAVLDLLDGKHHPE